MKLYLSKSNAADQNVVNNIRDLLKKYDCEVVEWNGVKGTYTHDQLMACDYMLVVPPAEQDHLIADNQTSIGLGQFEQIKAFRTKKDKSKVLIFFDIDIAWGGEDVDYDIDEVLFTTFRSFIEYTSARRNVGTKAAIITSSFDLTDDSTVVPLSSIAPFKPKDPYGVASVLPAKSYLNISDNRVKAVENKTTEVVPMLAAFARL